MSETLMGITNTVLIPIKHRFLFLRYYTYKLTPVVSHLMQLITNTNIRNIQNITIHNNLILLPHGFDAITFGTKSRKPHISVKKSYFKNNLPKNTQIYNWLEILSHEISHIKQIDKYRFLCFGFLPYVSVHLFYYIKSLSHDKSPLEQTPIHNQLLFKKFYNYSRRYGCYKYSAKFRNNK